jgi:hypothetical protein
MSNFDTWSDDWDKKHPVQRWIDKLFKDKGIAGYRPSYSILHPWKIMDYYIREAKYAWQRAFRGWDDTVIWSIDYYLAEKLPIWLMELKKNKTGVPSMFIIPSDEYIDEGIPCVSKEGMKRAEKEYDDILDKISVGFLAYKDVSDCKFDYNSPEEKAANKQFEDAFDLFKKYFGTFWD